MGRNKRTTRRARVGPQKEVVTLGVLEKVLAMPTPAGKRARRLKCSIRADQSDLGKRGKCREFRGIPRKEGRTGRRGHLRSCARRDESALARDGGVGRKDSAHESPLRAVLA